MGNQQTRSAGRREMSHVTCYAPNARSVFLTGSFNDWDVDALAMTRQPDGTWDVDLVLPPGRYEYTFVVDGTSCCDPHLKNGEENCMGCAPNRCGEIHRVLLVRCSPAHETGEGDANADGSRIGPSE